MQAAAPGAVAPTSESDIELATPRLQTPHPPEETSDMSGGTSDAGQTASPILKHAMVGRSIARPTTLAGWVLFSTTVAMMVSLFLPWAISGGSPSTDESSLSYSLVAVLLVVVLGAASSATVFPGVGDHDILHLGRLTVALTLLLVLTYDLGKTRCIGCPTMAPGVGLWIVYVSTWLYSLVCVSAWLVRSRHTASTGPGIGSQPL